MSITETIAPTRERMAKLSKAQVERPEESPTAKRKYHRTLSPFAVLYRVGKINEGCLKAADKLTKHYWGAQGVHVGDGDLNGHIGTDHDATEYPRTYHAQKLAQLRQIVDSARQWDVLLDMVEERADLAAAGKSWLGGKDKAQCYTAGLALARMGLDSIAEAFGMSDYFHPPNRKV